MTLPFLITAHEQRADPGHCRGDDVGSTFTNRTKRRPRSLRPCGRSLHSRRQSQRLDGSGQWVTGPARRECSNPDMGKSALRSGVISPSVGAKSVRFFRLLLTKDEAAHLSSEGRSLRWVAQPSKRIAGSALALCPPNRVNSNNSHAPREGATGNADGEAAASARPRRVNGDLRLEIVLVQTELPSRPRLMGCAEESWRSGAALSAIRP